MTGAARAWAIKDGGGAAGVVLDRAGTGSPPYPRGGGKRGGAFPGWVGYISQPFETTS